MFAAPGEAKAVAVQPNGRIVVAGTTEGQSGATLVRLMPGGSTDPTFGSDGIAGFSEPVNFFVASMALQLDGRILVGGSDSAGTGRLVVLRFLSDGEIDTTFGASGLAAVDFSPSSVGGGAIALQSDGKVVIVGGAGSGGVSDFAAARLNGDGTIDATFGSGGRVTVDMGAGASSSEAAESVVVRPDGRIVMGGRTDAPAGYALAVAGLLANGLPDPSFGAGGKVVLQIQQSAECRSLALQRDGKVVAVGPTFPEGPTLAVRLLPGGALDPSFGAGGIAIRNSVDPNAVAVDSSGGIDIAGEVGSFAFTRLLPDGSLDPAIGPLGFIQTFPQPQGHSHADAIAIQPDGRAVAAGAAGEFAFDFAVARFTAEVSTIPTLSGVGFFALAVLLAGASLVALGGADGLVH